MVILRIGVKIEVNLYLIWLLPAPFLTHKIQALRKPEPLLLVKLYYFNIFQHFFWFHISLSSCNEFSILSGVRLLSLEGSENENRVLFPFGFNRHPTRQSKEETEEKEHTTAKTTWVFPSMTNKKGWLSTCRWFLVFIFAKAISRKKLNPQRKPFFQRFQTNTLIFLSRTKLYKAASPLHSLINCKVSWILQATKTNMAKLPTQLLACVFFIVLVLNSCPATSQEVGKLILAFSIPYLHFVFVINIQN